MAPNISDRASDPLLEAYLRATASRQAPKRRITFETVAWSLGVALMAYLLFVAVAGILYAG